MSFNAAKQQGAAPKRRAPLLDPGAYPARLVGLITLGLQPQRPYQGQDKPPANELMTTYELVDEFMPDEDGNPDEEKPRWLSETFVFHNLAADKATSTKRYLALDPDQKFGGDWSAVIGTAVNVSVAVRDGQGKNVGKKFENITGTSPMRPKEAAKLPELVNPPRVFDFYSPTEEGFFSLPEWLQDKMKGALDYEGSDLEAIVKARAAKGGDDGPPKKDEEKPKKRREPEPKDEDEDDEIPW